MNARQQVRAEERTARGLIQRMRAGEITAVNCDFGLMYQMTKHAKAGEIEVVDRGDDCYYRYRIEWRG